MCTYVWINTETQTLGFRELLWLISSDLKFQMVLPIFSAVF